MVLVRFATLRNTSLWWAIVGAGIALAALFGHPALETEAAIADVAQLLFADIEEYLIFAVTSFGLLWWVSHHWLAKRQISRRR